MILGDNLFYGAGLTPLLNRAAARTNGATVFAYRVSDPERYGVVSFDEAGRATASRKSRARRAPIMPSRASISTTARHATIASRLRPSARGELEITDLNRVYLERGTLAVERIGRGIAWLDTGNPDTLLQAANFVQIVELRQGLKIACLEEVALNLGYIEIDQVLALAKPIANTDYGRYLLQLSQRHDGPA